MPSWFFFTRIYRDAPPTKHKICIFSLPVRDGSRKTVKFTPFVFRFVFGLCRGMFWHDMEEGQSQLLPYHDTLLSIKHLHLPLDATTYITLQETNMNLPSIWNYTESNNAAWYAGIIDSSARSMRELHIALGLVLGLVLSVGYLLLWKFCVNVMLFGLHATDNLQIRFITTSWDDIYRYKIYCNLFLPILVATVNTYTQRLCFVMNM